MVQGKVLVVDDAEAIVESLGQALVMLGVEPADLVQAADGTAAMKAFKEHEPHLVFMDIDLGGDKGEKVAQKMLMAEPATKVILMTGLDRGDPRVRTAVSAGAYEVLEKPLRLARIRQVLDLIESEEKGYRRL